MRITVTLDDDVAAALASRRAERGTSLRREVNELLGVGIAFATGDKPAAEPYVLPTFDPGRALISDIRALRELIDEEDDRRSRERNADCTTDTTTGRPGSRSVSA